MYDFTYITGKERRKNICIIIRLITIVAIFTEEMIIHLFGRGDDRLGPVKKRLDASWYASEMVTIGLLFVVRGGQYRSFSRWLAANDGSLFPALPDLTRLLRLVRQCSA